MDKMITTQILTEQLKRYVAGALPKEAAEKMLHFISLEENREIVTDAFCALGLEQEPDALYLSDRFEPMLERAMSIDKTTAIPAQEGLHHQEPTLEEPAVILALPDSGNHITAKSRYAWLKYAAAVLIIAFSATFYFRNKEKVATPVVAMQQQLQENQLEQATLTLSDGRVIALDSIQTGKLADQGSTDIIKLDDGGLAYKAGTAASSEMLYNTIKTPKGLQYRIVLPDGSTVWLNASSSIKFPARFTGKTRTVEITGEAFFEVKKNTELPFMVQTKHLGVGVLGTSFNINCYEDEPASTLTLKDGSVQLHSDYGTVILKPGEQGFIENNQLKTKQVDVGLATAWKEGVFDFNDKDLPGLMRQIARWYAIEVKYEGDIPSMNFMGKVKRELSLEGMLNVLKRAGVHYEMRNGNILIIK